MMSVKPAPWGYTLRLHWATHCSFPNPSVKFRAVQCTTVQCNDVQCTAVQCSAVQCSAVQCSALLCSAAEFSAESDWSQQRAQSPVTSSRPHNFKLCTVNCVVYSELYTVHTYSVQCMVCSAQCRMYGMQCEVYCVVCRVKCTV